MKHIRPYKDQQPLIADSAYVDPSAIVIGDVELKEQVSVWPLTVIRGDVNRIRIGARSNIQDGTVIHVTKPRPQTPKGFATLIGEDVTVGHKVMLHGCTIGDRVVVGMGAIVMDGVEVASDVIIAAGSLVTPGKKLSSGFLYAGSPVKQIRPLRESEKEHFADIAANYVELKEDYR